MKIKELKHNHSLTDLLKVLLFSILMLAPILAIGVKCAYVVINKNAKDSYSGTNQNTEEIVNVSTITDFDYSKTYKLGNSYLTSNANATGSGYMYFDSVNVLIQNEAKPLNNVDRMYIYANNNTMYYNFYDGNTNITYGSSENFLLEVKIRSFYGSSQQIEILNFDLEHSNTLYYIDYYTQQQLDNVFYYAINEIAQEPLFNWTQNTAIYTGVNAMCTGMEITSPIIPILITYWFLLTCIYVIIDILIKGFTMLTHLIGSKIA